MDYTMPQRISNEKDLRYYEEYLKNDDTLLLKENNASSKMTESTVKAGNKALVERDFVPACKNNTKDMFFNPIFFQGHLKKQIGKLIKVESLIGNCLENRVGVLLEVGADFIVLKLHRSNCTMMIQMSTIKYITVVHDNDWNKTAIY